MASNVIWTPIILDELRLLGIDDEELVDGDALITVGDTTYPLKGCVLPEGDPGIVIRTDAVSLAIQEGDNVDLTEAAQEHEAIQAYLRERGLTPQPMYSTLYLETPYLT